MIKSLVSSMKWGSICAPFKIRISGAILSTLILAGIATPQTALSQTSSVRPSWWLGAAAGANFNFYRGSTQKLNADLTLPAALHNGFGVGAFAGPTIEFYRAKTRLGFMLQTGYDSKRGTFHEELTPCNCPMDLSSKLSYITIEPSLRFAPFQSDFYLYAGPRFAFNIGKSFTYQQGTNPEFPEQVQDPEVKGDMSDIKKTQISMQVGAGYDIHVSSPENKTQFVISPFVAYQPYFGQTPRSIETWNITTLRAGASFKFGAGKRSKSADQVEATDRIEEPVITPVAVAPALNFRVNAPANIATERTVRETFPLRNYVFFNTGSTEIPDRYVLLDKSQVASFKEDQVELFTPKNLSGRSDRQMVVYYNILNILGDRMGKNPTATINLVGSSELGKADGLLMAESVKRYLVNVFSINAGRITTEGRSEPKIPSLQPGGTEELALLIEGDRRVSIESTSPAMLMEFQSGPNASLKPVQIIDTQEAPVESYLTFNNPGSDTTFTSWSMEIRDDKGVVQNYGPYTVESIAIPGKTIMGTRAEGRYNVKMTGITPDGTTISKDTTVQMVLWTPSKEEVAMRFSVIYEFNESKAISIYEKYLTEVVTPQISAGSTVIIHGYTDIIGDAAHNLKLSQQRAEDVSKIIKASLAKTGRTDVKFDVHGSGEDTKLSPFDNKFPEERFYNRSVIIDIIPKK